MNNRYIIFHYHFDKIAGTERVIHNLLEFFSKSQISRVTLLLAGKETELAFDLSELNLEVVFLGADINESNFFKLLVSHIQLFFQFYRFCKLDNAQEDNIYLTTNPFLSVIAWLSAIFCRRAAKAIISCEHFSITVSGKISNVMRKLFYRYFYVVTLTEKDKNFIINRFNPLYCTCIPNAVSIEPANYLNHGNKIILSIGRMASQKGFDRLIEAYSKIAYKFPEWKLIIVGDDYGEKPHLIELIGKYKLFDKIILHPATNRIFEYYRKASFYVLSSRFEGLPMVILEAMAFGLPVIAFDCPTGPAELVDDKNGFLVKNGDIQTLADKMELLITDEELLLKKSSGSENRIKQYTKQEINILWINLLTKINSHSS